MLKKLSLELVRPVSNLKFISKVTEKAALSCFITHLKERNLLPSYQSVYASTLGNVIDDNISVMGYADDHALYSTSYTNTELISLSLINIESCLEKIGVWMVENRLKMNQEKTEFIAFGSSHCIEQLQVQSIKVGNDPVEISSHVEYLSVWLDSKLNMKKHISESAALHL